MQCQNGNQNHSFMDTEPRLDGMRRQVHQCLQWPLSRWWAVALS